MKKKIVSSLLTIILLFSVFSTSARTAFFTDTANHWASAVIDTWSEYGVILGSDGMFKPDDYITRGDFAIIINRVMKYVRESPNIFSDLDTATPEQRNAILRLNAAGIMLGDGSSMRPYSTITRQEAVVLLGRMMRVEPIFSGGINYNDMSSISSWAVGMVRATSTLGFVTGRANGNFDPHSYITRAEVVQIIDNMVKGFFYKSGTYGISTLGNAVINTSGVELKQLTITGDLFITEGVAEGVVTLTDVTVNGNVYVMGGGPASVKFAGHTNVGKVYHEKLSGNTTKYQVIAPASVNQLFVNPNTVSVEFEGNIKNIYLNATNQSVKMTNAIVNNLMITAPGITLTTNENTSVAFAEINYKVQILGKALFSNVSLAPAADGSTIEKQPRRTVLPSSTTVFMNGQTFLNTGIQDQIITAADDVIAPIVANTSLSATNLTTNGATLNWTVASDNITPVANLRYAIYYSTSQYMRTVEEIEEYGVMASAFTANKLTAPLTGLISGQTYYFNVIVKDAADNKSCYARYELRIGNDTTAPVVSAGSLRASNLKNTSLTLDWSAASDNATATEKIKYTVYQSETSNITTYAACEANGKAIMAAKVNTLTFNVSGLTENKTYYFNVVAQDEGGNKTAYTQISITPSKDTAAPRISYPAITISNLKEQTARLNWSAASDETTPAENLKYALYRSKQANISTVEEIKANGGTPYMALSENILFYDLPTQPANGSAYYYNVLVQDAAGNQSCYTMTHLGFGDDITAPGIPDNEITGKLDSGTAFSITWKTANDLVSATGNAVVGTPANELIYAVYYVKAPLLNNDISKFAKVSDIERNAQNESGFMQNRYSYSLTGLETNVAYYVNVIVKDKAGNKSCYSPLLIRTDLTAPKVSYPIVNSSANLPLGDELSFSWSPATDETTTQANLEYAIYFTKNTEYINVADVLKNGTLFDTYDYSANRTSAKLTALPYGVKYYIYVVVRDEAGNCSKYNTVFYERIDMVPPSLPSDDLPKSTTSYVQSTSNYIIDLYWNNATDAVSPQSELTYSLYFTDKSTMFFTIDEVIKNTELLARGKGMLNYTHPNRPSGYAYYYLVVEDAAGNKVLYKRCVVDVR